MRLTRKLTFALAAAILLVLSVNATIRITLELAVYEADVKRDSHLLGRAVAGAAALIWKRVGMNEALDLVADANERESAVTIRWVWLDAPDGAPDAPELPAAVRATNADGKDASYRWRAPGEETDALYTYARASVPGGRPWAVELRETLAAEDAFVRRSVLQSTLATGLLVLICAAIALGLGAVLVGRPVRKLVAQAQRIGAGDLTPTLASTQRDEIGELALAMDTMAARIAAARTQVEVEIDARIAAVEQLRHADRLTTVGKLAAGIAHEIGTPLNVIIGYAKLLSDEHAAGSPSHEHAGLIANQAHRVTDIVRALLDFARPRAPRKALEDLTLIVPQVMSLLQPLAQKREVRLALGPCPPGLFSQVDAGQMQQVLTNLIVNAIAASPRGACVHIEAGVRVAQPPVDHGGRAGTWACIRVRDEGPGIDPEVLPRIFEPFFTTKEPGEGTGLGLSVAYGIVKEHGGWLEVETSPGRGTSFALFLSFEPAEPAT